METKQHFNRRKTDKPDSGYQRCQCGWVGSEKQLGIWLRKDQVVSRICPHCGTPSPLQRTLTFQGQLSRMVH